MDSEVSSCCCFLLRLLFLVQKTAHARGAVREARGLHIVRCLRLGGYPFFETIFWSPVSLKIAILDEKCSQHGVTMRSFGSYVSEKVRNRKSVFGLRRRVRIAYERVL